MRVVITRERVVHLIVLLAVSGVLAELLETQLGFAKLSAWGFGVTLVCQLNAFVEKYRAQAAQDAIDAVPQANPSQVDADANPKKKKAK